MDIDMEISDVCETRSPQFKTNILVIGERKSGKTTLIKSFFELFGVSPETYFLLDSVKIWENFVSLQGLQGQKTQHKISFIETDVDVPVLVQINKFEDELRGNHNILCLVMKSSESSTLKSQNRIRNFYERFNGISQYFSESIIITNNYFKKKDVINDMQHIYLSEMQSVFSNIIYYDFSEIQKLFYFFLNRITNYREINSEIKKIKEKIEINEIKEICELKQLNELKGLRISKIIFFNKNICR